MREDLKQKLDESVPEDVTLSDAKKREILMAAQNRDSGRKPSRMPKMLPALAGVAVIGLGGILGYPYMSDWQEGRGAVEEQLAEPQKLVVPEQDYEVLVPSIYNDQSKELLYNDNDKLFAFDPSSDTETLLVDLDEGTRSFQFGTAGKWLAWEEYSDESSKLKIMDRETEKVETLEDVFVIDIQMEGDHLVYGRIGGEDKPKYQSVDLNTMEVETVHEMAGDGAMSAASIWDNKLVIPEMGEEEGETVSNFYLYDLEDNSLVEKFTLPYPTASGVLMDNDRIYAQFGDESMEDSFLGYVDIQSGKVTEIPAPDFVEFAVYSDYLALSLAGEADSSDLQLYKMAGTELEEVPAFSGVEERLVRPRFTEEGTLVVNGEGEDLAMYLLDVMK